MTEFITPNKDVTQMIIDAGGKDLLTCYQCGTCTGSCPWGLVGHLGVRNMIHLASLGLEGFESEDIWKCTTCATCVSRCPREVEIIDIIRSVRGQLAEMNLIPPPLRTALSSITANGNPWLGDRKDRTGWIKDVDVKHISEAGTSTLYFTCCTPAYDPKTRSVARAMVRVLQSAGINFGILGSEASCCGDAVHRFGNPTEYEALAKSNAALFRKYGVREIITTSPHCYNIFTKYYQGLDGITVKHYTEVIAEALADKRLELKTPFEATVTYHDPCYMGRHNEIYDSPRSILKAVPGLTFTEMSRIRQDALCCGGGGGGAWMETKPGERFSELRVGEAAETGAGVVATSCPFCILMLVDATKTTNRDESMKIMDVAEIVAAAL